MSHSAIDVFLPAIAASAAITVASLALLQTDRVSRLTSSAKVLNTKRRREYAYQWKTAVERAHLQLDFYLAGGREAFNDDPEASFKRLEYISNEQDQEQLIKRILSDSDQRFSTLKIDKDPQDPTEEFYLYLMAEKDTSTETVRREFFQVPLVPFALKLQEAFENHLTSTTLCFVADASSGQASSLIEDIAREAKTGIAIVSEPLWMVNMARLAEAGVIARKRLQAIVFALCRMDAWSQRNQCKESRTVMFTFPGQSTVPSLLPLVQAAFPQDRHVFAYDGCVASVERGLASQMQFRRGTVQAHLEFILSSLAQDPIRFTTPLPSKSPLTKSVLKLESTLAELPVSQARVVESWMSSVDAFFKLKEEENQNGYLPYVFKMGFLTRPEGGFEKASNSFWSVASLLQFITGTRSKPVSEGVMDSAIEFLKDYNASLPTSMALRISEENRKAVENCVFQHKSILIGNKTLKDTVLPTQHWTLKQASRAGCSCCGPDPYDEEDKEGDDEPESKEDGIDLSVPGGFAMANGVRKTTNFSKPAPPEKVPRYVDGKTTFAFDPTRFSIP